MQRSRWVGLNQSGRVDLFWERVDRSGGPDACWPWIGSRIWIKSRPWAERYGWLNWFGKPSPAHRVALLLTVGPPPKDKPIGLHSCDSRPCCNPRHLRWGTYKENAQDAFARGGMKPPYASGEDAPGAKLTQAEVDEIRAAWPTESQASLARRFGLVQGNISRIVNRRSWLD